MKVVVLDDEEKVCNLIINLVDWNRLGLEVVGVAHNGIDGLALIKQERPDIVITDIRMPGIDGIQLIAEIRRELPRTQCIIISGYRQFEYAQTAIQFGVENYLLKPINQEELTATLEKLCGKQRQRIEELNSLEASIDHSRSLLFSRLEQNGQPIPDIEELNTVFKYRFQNALYRLAIVKFDIDRRDDSPTVFSSEMAGVLYQKISQLMHQFLDPVCIDCECHWTDSWAYLVCNYTAAQREAVSNALRLVLEELSLYKTIFAQLQCTMGVGSEVAAPQDLPESLLFARRCVVQRLVTGAGGMIVDCPPPVPYDPEPQLGTWGKALDSLFDTLDLDSIAAIVKEFDHGIPTQLNGTNLYEIFREAGFRMFVKAADRFPGLVNDWYDTRFTVGLDLCPDRHQLLLFLEQEMTALFQRIKEYVSQEQSRPIREAKAYIQEHYKDATMSLEQVSDAVGFNSSYFSALFKKETGQGFLEYLTEVRLKAAKDLLRNSHMGIGDIAAEVGYTDSKYFTKIFKKNTGIKPNEFRKLYT